MANQLKLCILVLAGLVIFADYEVSYLLRNKIMH